MKVKTLGFPVIHNYPGDIREFTPNLFKYLEKFTHLEYYLEEGYGERLGYTKEDYTAVNTRIHFVPLEEVYKQDMIAILKNPDLKNLELMRDGASLFSMIHYDSRPAAVELITRKKIQSFSMDAIVDDYGIRTFVDYFGTAFSGCEIAFAELKKRKKDFHSTERGPIKVTIVGAGGVGQNAVKSFEVLSDKEFLGTEYTGVVSSVLTRTMTGNEAALKEIFSTTDILVDASKRFDYSQHIISNKMLGYLPEDAIILDLSADRYVDSEPRMVRAFEGTVKGTPSEKVLLPDNKAYDELPAWVDSTNRRVVVSCDAWPSVDPHKSIAVYELLMKNFFNVLLAKEDLDDVSIESDDTFERGLARSTITYFLENYK